MAEYIERDAIIGKAIDEKCFVFSTQDVVRDEFVVKTCYKNLAEVVYSIPAADVAPVVHGEWIGPSGMAQGKCSVCGYMTYDKSADWARNYWPHCPKCGAKMDGGDGDAAD